MDRLYLAGFYTLKFLIFILPSSLQNLLAKFLAFAFMKLKKKRFHIVMTNLDLAFGETKTKEEKLEIAKKCYYNFAKYLGINFILNQNTTKQKILEQVVFKNEHFLLDAIKSDRPIIVTTAHFGQWEIFPLAVAAHFGPSSVLGRKLDSSVMDKILRANRAQFDVELIDKNGGAKDILKALKARRIVGILVDQNTAPKDGIKVQFFGKNVLHTPAASVLAQKTNALIINAFIYQKGENLNEICFEQPIDISTFDKEDAVQKATQMQCSACEEMVRARPEEYFWFHQRFKRFYENEYKC
ncbi:MAG: lipid A biosynthesis lauroyl acyltransferase [Campylobacter concisus]|uniref:Lipid A biosynthesis lauroyl acyltransferase n=1 Tax=Campylobacter concisus TaxID=199 RepID=A0A7S9RD71_9BACT|nr:lipid A biosynthesis lauroyl acyltransferase [Campylobacter concisus]MBF0923812.1 lipid A biosynthesis lauroyl acyltransferase [Campylobacter concisus]QPH89493.1 lipid A biosynthesis lauroyl acyltransferase [Campylobacter concisus]VTX99135.1 Lipid A biosynthesis lauroyltransferase [Campylobacter concisus]